jgi:hypothetical protein
MTAILTKQVPVIHETDAEHNGGANFCSVQANAHEARLP